MARELRKKTSERTNETPGVSIDLAWLNATQKKFVDYLPDLASESFSLIQLRKSRGQQPEQTLTVGRQIAPPHNPVYAQLSNEHKVFMFCGNVQVAREEWGQFEFNEPYKFAHDQIGTSRGAKKLNVLIKYYFLVHNHIQEFGNRNDLNLVKLFRAVCRSVKNGLAATITSGDGEEEPEEDQEGPNSNQTRSEIVVDMGSGAEATQDPANEAEMADENHQGVMRRMFPGGVQAGIDAARTNAYGALLPAPAGPRGRQKRDAGRGGRKRRREEEERGQEAGGPQNGQDVSERPSKVQRTGFGEALGHISQAKERIKEIEAAHAARQKEIEAMRKEIAKLEQVDEEEMVEMEERKNELGQVAELLGDFRG